jgi:hypothetical protein
MSDVPTAGPEEAVEDSPLPKDQSARRRRKIIILFSTLAAGGTAAFAAAKRWGRRGRE